MDKNEPTHIIYMNAPLSDAIDYVYAIADPVQQAMMKVYGLLMGDA